MEKIQLRNYQIEAIKNLKLSFNKGNKKILLVAPTASGKTGIWGRAWNYYGATNSK